MKSKHSWVSRTVMIMAKFGVPTDEQLAKINKLAKRTLSTDEVFCFSGKSAGDMMIPGRYMMLSPELLKVMADDAKKGVSFMLNHNWSSFGGVQAVPYGKVFDGRLENSNGTNETVSLLLDKYIVRDDEVVDGVSANALIKKIETGVLSDTSIGWGTDIMTCSICGMNYYGGQCSHLKGRTYEMADGTMKQCTVTAMPPSMMIPYNNNALFEESIVWDGAYPGACVTQSKHGDIIELPTGIFTIVQDKEELPENTQFLGYYHNGDIITMVKKSEPKKVFGVKGGEKQMNEKLTKLLETLGITYKEGETKSEELLNQLAEKWSVTPEVKPQEGKVESYITQDQVKEKLGKEVAADEVLSLAKEGQDYLKKLSDEALAMGVRAMGNEFKKETWEKTFATMSTKDILDITATWETQAKAGIPAGRRTDAGAGLGTEASFAPDEAYKVGK
jgi:hypothetical protein